MSRAPKTPVLNSKDLEIQRIRVRRDGYDANGAHWGAGPDVFVARCVGPSCSADTKDTTDEITVRARTMDEARQKIAAVLARAPGEPITAREHLGGASPHKSRYEIDWRDPAGGLSVRIRITHSRDYLGLGQDHVEIESMAPKRAPLPITETGYKSHFLSALELVNAGGPVTFVTAWLAEGAKSKAWRDQVHKKAQGDLFQWAATKGEIEGRKTTCKVKSKVKSRRADGTPSRRLAKQGSRRPRGSDGADPA